LERPWFGDTNLSFAADNFVGKHVFVMFLDFG